MMTIVPNSRADRYVTEPPAGVRFFLVHGSEEALVNERARAIVQGQTSGATDPLRLTRYDGDEVSRHPTVLWDEAYALSLFGESRAIWIDAQGRDLVAAVQPLFGRPPEGCTLLIKAGVLRKGSPLRSMFEAEPQAASIECYPDSRDTLESLIDFEIRASGLEMSSQARTALLETLEGDRQTTRNEISKLILYAYDAGKITRDDVVTVLGGQALSAVDDLVDRTLLQERSSVAAGAIAFFESGIENELLMPRLVARLMLLYRLRSDIDQGNSVESAQRSIGIKLPMSAAANLTVQARRWSSSGISRQLSTVRTVTRRARSDPSSVRLIITRMLWSLASQAGPTPH